MKRPSTLPTRNELRKPPTFEHYASRTSSFELYRWQKAILCPLIQRLATDRGMRVAFHAPPQSGKSSLLSQRGIAWLLGMDPMYRIGLACYNETHSGGFGSVVKSLMLSQDHAALFPDWLGRIKPNAPQGGFRTEARIRENDGQYSFLAMGLQSGATGKGFTHLFMDDPYKNSEEARSELINEKVWRFWSATVGPRVDDGANVVCMFHRYVDDDLAGRLIEQGFEYIRLPILQDDNEDLADPTHGTPIREPDGRLSPYRSFSWINSQKVNDPHTFNGQFQGTPRIAGGNLFRDEWFREYAVNQAGSYLVGRETYLARQCHTFISVDLAASEKESADWTVLCVWLVTPRKDLLLLDVIRERVNGPGAKRLIRKAYGDYHPTFIAIDRTGLGLPIVQDLQEEGLPVRGVLLHKDPYARAEGGAVRYEAGKVFHPAASEAAPWLSEALKELTGFPNAKHDDIVNAICIGALMTAQPHGIFHEFSPALHMANDTLYGNPDAPLVCGWSFDPSPAWVMGQEQQGQLRVLACLVGHPGQGVYEFGANVADLLTREFGPLTDLNLNHFARPAFCGYGGANQHHATASRILALGDQAEPWSEARPGWGWNLLPGPENRDARDETVRTRLNTNVRGVPSFVLDPGCAELVDALSGGYAYRILPNGQVSPEPEKNSHLALVEALGCVASSLYAVTRMQPVVEDEDEYRPHAHGTAGGAGRRSR